MAYIKVTDSVIDVVHENEVEDSTEITADEISMIATSKYGHRQFRYIKGNVVLDESATEEIDMEVEKAQAINQAINEELIFLAEQSAAIKLDSIRRARNKSELTIAKELP